MKWVDWRDAVDIFASAAWRLGGAISSSSPPFRQQLGVQGDKAFSCRHSSDGALISRNAPKAACACARRTFAWGREDLTPWPTSPTARPGIGPVVPPWSSPRACRIGPARVAPIRPPARVDQASARRPMPAALPVSPSLHIPLGCRPGFSDLVLLATLDPSFCLSPSLLPLPFPFPFPIPSLRLPTCLVLPRLTPRPRLAGRPPFP